MRRFSALLVFGMMAQAFAIPSTSTHPTGTASVNSAVDGGVNGNNLPQAKVNQNVPVFDPAAHMVDGNVGGGSTTNGAQSTNMGLDALLEVFTGDDGSFRTRALDFAFQFLSPLFDQLKRSKYGFLARLKQQGRMDRMALTRAGAYYGQSAGRILNLGCDPVRQFLPNNQTSVFVYSR